MHIAEALQRVTNTLISSGSDAPEAASQARLLVAARAAIPYAALFFHLQDDFNYQLLEPDLAALAAGQPLQYILGETAFMGLSIRVRPCALIPRLDSEALLEAAIFALREHPAPQLADLCTGSGAFALAFAHYLPRAEVVASDISSEALALAEENAAALGLSSRVQFAQGDLFAALPPASAQFDLISINPPYIPQAELASLPPQVRQEPRLALDGGADGLDFYRRIAAQAAPFLTARGLLLLEHGDDQQDAVAQLFIAAGYAVQQRLKDYGQRPRGLLLTRPA